MSEDGNIFDKYVNSVAHALGISVSDMHDKGLVSHLIPSGYDRVGFLDILMDAKNYNGFDAYVGMGVNAVSSAVDAYTDPLTGLHSRRYFDERLIEEYSRAARVGSPLALVMTDVVDFKKINDISYQAGDVTLANFGHMVRNTSRRHDIAARNSTGADEFFILMFETDLDGGIKAADLMCKRARQITNTYNGDNFVATLRAGVSVYPYKNGTHHVLDIDDLMRTTDKAIKASKISGRNGVVSVRDLS